MAIFDGSEKSAAIKKSEGISGDRKISMKITTDHEIRWKSKNLML